MHVRTFPPSARLSPFVRVFELVETRQEMTRTLVPDTGILIGLRYRGAATLLEGTTPRVLPDGVVTGLRATARRMHTSPNGAIVIAKFREGGAAPFFAEPLHRLFGASIALDDLMPHADADRLSARMEEAPSDAGRIAIFEDFLLPRMRPHTPDPTIQAAVRAIHTRRGATRIGALARELGISQDALEKRFRSAVGTSPKRLASILRMRSALAAYKPELGLARLSHEADYFDQSHFNREFRSVFGATPGQLLPSAEYC